MVGAMGLADHCFKAPLSIISWQGSTSDGVNDESSWPWMVHIDSQCHLMKTGVVRLRLIQGSIFAKDVNETALTS